MPIRMSGLTSGLDTNTIISELMSAQKTKLTKIENKQTKLTWQQDRWKELNTKLYSLFQDKVSKLKLQSTYMKKKVSSSNESKATASGNATSVNGTHTLEIKQLASSQYVTSSKLATDQMGEKVTASTSLTDLGFATGSTITVTAGSSAADNLKTVDLDVDAETTIQDFLSTCQKAGLNASFDSEQGRIFLSSKESGSENEFHISSADSGVSGSTGVEALGLGDNGTTVAATDAIYRYNGTEFTSTSNTVTANGLTFQLTGTTSGYDNANAADRESVTITVNTDVDAVYDTIKDFFTSYNELLKEMNTAYYANSARGYEPLSSEEKEAMTDEEVELWEKKIKDSLLRNDSTLGSLITGMKGALSKSVTVGGESYSLSTFGISTSTDYTEKGLLHIYGDESDSAYANKKDKLKTALINDPENTMKALTGIFTNLFTEMQDKMKSTTMSSALTFYNDKQMTKLETQYKKDYSEMEDKLQDIEDRYYKQFSAMETAMAKLNSQQSALAGMLGNN